LAQLRQSRAEIDGGGRFADATFLISDCDDLHSRLRILSGLRELPDDVAACNKRKLNFSDFGFGISAVAFKRPACESFSIINRAGIGPENRRG
jgi:hypothetical protein